MAFRFISSLWYGNVERNALDAILHRYFIPSEHQDKGSERLHKFFVAQFSLFATLMLWLGQHYKTLRTRDANSWGALVVLCVATIVRLIFMVYMCFVWMSLAATWQLICEVRKISSDGSGGVDDSFFAPPSTTLLDYHVQ